jgi:hypothetical protein
VTGDAPTSARILRIGVPRESARRPRRLAREGEQEAYVGQGQLGQDLRVEPAGDAGAPAEVA